MTSSTQKHNLFWFRRDLRLTDNHGLFQALTAGIPVKAIFIFDNEIIEKLDNPYDRRIQFIYQTLQTIKQQLQALGSDLWIYHGKPNDVFASLTTAENVQGVYSNRDYEPYAMQRDLDIQNLVAKNGVAFSQFKDQVIFERNEVVKDDGNPYTVYTPFSKKWKSLFKSAMAESFPTELHFNHFLKGIAPETPSLKSMGFDEQPFRFPATQVKNDILINYGETRDIPSIQGTSRLSVHLRFGTISIRQLLRQGLETSEKYVNELIWREFYMQILWHFPRVVNQAFKPKYDLIAWRNNPAEFELWCKGETGYPIVDAGMRELLATGFMHNRVRMVVASFLTKHLLIDWRWGEAWFAKHLLDFELASNNGGWQWAAGSGVDAAPYFRVFNPTLQTLKFDPQFKYIRQWVPEFDTLRYPKPMVVHELARKRCLEVYQQAVGPAATKR